MKSQRFKNQKKFNKNTEVTIRNKLFRNNSTEIYIN